MKKNDSVLLVVLVLIALLNLYQYFVREDIGGLFVFGIGGILILIQLIKQKIPSSILYLWILAQLPILITTSFSYAPTTYPINFAVGISSNVFELKLNIIPLFFFGMYKVYQMNALIGEQFIVKQFPNNNDNPINKYLPLECEAVEVIKSNNSKNKWIKLVLENEIVFNDTSFDFILVKPKDEKVYDRKTFLPSHIKIGNANKTLAVKGWVLVKKKE